MINRFSQLMRLCLFCIMLAPCYAHAEALSKPTLRVELTGLKDASGNVYIAVYNSDDTWLGDDTVLQQKVAIAEALDGEVVRTELALPPGEYALSIFYDSNEFA